MRNSILMLMLFLSYNCMSQKSTAHFKKVYDYDAYHKDWAMVKTVADTYGFIDRNGNEIVDAVYSKIYKFEIKSDNKKYAMIKNVAGAYGFINENGKEIVQAIHWKKEEAIQKLDIIINVK